MYPTLHDISLHEDNNENYSTLQSAVPIHSHPIFTSAVPSSSFYGNSITIRDNNNFGIVDRTGGPSGTEQIASDEHSTLLPTTNLSHSTNGSIMHNLSNLRNSIYQRTRTWGSHRSVLPSSSNFPFVTSSESALVPTTDNSSVPSTVNSSPPPPPRTNNVSQDIIIPEPPTITANGLAQVEVVPLSKRIIITDLVTACGYAMILSQITLLAVLAPAFTGFTTTDDQPNTSNTSSIPLRTIDEAWKQETVTCEEIDFHYLIILFGLLCARSWLTVLILTILRYTWDDNLPTYLQLRTTKIFATLRETIPLLSLGLSAWCIIWLTTCSACRSSLSKSFPHILLLCVSVVEFARCNAWLLSLGLLQCIAQSSRDQQLTPSDPRPPMMPTSCYILYRLRIIDLRFISSDEQSRLLDQRLARPVGISADTLQSLAVIMYSPRYFPSKSTEHGSTNSDDRLGTKSILVDDKDANTKINTSLSKFLYPSSQSQDSSSSSPSSSSSTGGPHCLICWSSYRRGELLHILDCEQARYYTSNILHPSETSSQSNYRHGQRTRSMDSVTITLPQPSSGNLHVTIDSANTTTTPSLNDTAVKDIISIDPIHDEEILITDNYHHFHAACLKRWLLVNNSCPVCRTKVRSDCVLYTVNNFLQFPNSTTLLPNAANSNNPVTPLLSPNALIMTTTQRSPQFLQSLWHHLQTFFPIHTSSILPSNHIIVHDNGRNQNIHQSVPTLATPEGFTYMQPTNLT